MRLKRRRLAPCTTLLPVYLAALITFLGCATPSAPGSALPPQTTSNAQTKKTLSVAIAGEPRTLSDAINQANSGGVPGVAEVENLIAAGMVRRHGETGAVLPYLAEAPPTLENGLWRLLPDGRMQTTLTLRADAIWHDGTPVTTDDLLFTMAAAQDPEIGVLSHVGLRSVEGVEAQDSRTLTVHWKQPYIDANLLFSDRFAMPLPRHLLLATYENDRANFVHAPYWTEKFVGTGPYRIRDYVTGSHMILSANDRFILGKARIDEIEVRFIQDANALIANLLAGQVQMTLGRRLSIEQGIEVSSRWPEGRVEISMSNWVSLYPQFINPNPPVISNVQFRRALLHMMDRQQMSEELTNGLTGPAHGPISPNQPEYRAIQDQIVTYAFDPRRAAQLIESLGYMRGTDGFFVDTAGQRLQVENRTTAGDDFRNKMLFSIATDWQRAGIGVETNLIPRQRADDREYRATRPGFELVRQPPAPERYYSREAPLPENGFRGNSRTRYRNPELDAIIDRYFTTIPYAERMQALGEFVHHLTDQVIVLGVLFNAEPLLLSNRVQNVIVARPDGVRDTWNAYEWDLK